MINGNTIIQIGVRPGPKVGQALAYAQKALSQGENWEVVKANIKEKFANEPPKLHLRENPLQVYIAAEPTSKEEQENIHLSTERMKELSLCPIIENVALMPDTCPTGSDFGAIPVGGAITTRNAILPSAHSADICCSMHTTFFQSKEDPKSLLQKLNHSTLFGPFGFPQEKRVEHPILQEANWTNPFLTGLQEVASKYLGTQGDGNHFASIGEIQITHPLIDTLYNHGYSEIALALNPYKGTSLYALTTHHGSRALGAKVYKRGTQAAQAYTKEVSEKVPKNLAWLDTTTPTGKAYLEALDYVGKWTLTNHKIIHEKFLIKAGIPAITEIGNQHNFLWQLGERISHGKGATPAWKDPQGRAKLGIIPLNMGREILLVLGKNNPEFLSFAPHGAGRNKSRSATIRPFKNPETGKVDPKKVSQAIQAQTKGIHILWASGKPDISESPMGYKNPNRIKEELNKFSLATVISEITPKACIMAGEFDAPWKNKKKKP